MLQGELKEEIFAARLKDVVDGRAEAVYQDPAYFYANTYPTDGLRALLREALGRLTRVKPTNNPIIRLETSFGGGKTHNLIALFHAASGLTPVDSLHGIVLPDLLPAPGAVDIAAVVGTDLSPSDGLLHQDGVRTFTLWGELAYQLGGAEGYERARRSDLDRSAPGTGLFDELVGDRPTLIMIDEIARHMRAAQSVPTATGRSNLAEQTVAFLMSLLEFTVGRATVVTVITLTGSEDAFAAESDDLRQQFDEARAVSARQEMVLNPTGEKELAAIVTHRMFERVDAAAAEATAGEYAAAYQMWSEQRVVLPEPALRADYAEDMRKAYPFHPELLNTLNRKTATIPNFQRTRGALRLLALVVRQLWQTRPAGTGLIHVHDIDLGQADIASDLTSRLQRAPFQSVIQADIVSAVKGSPAHAQVIDQTWVDAGKPPYARHVAVAVFLHSLTQGVASGVDPAELRLAVLEPGDDPLLFDKALDRLEDKAWYFDWDGHRYRFRPEVSLGKIVHDEMGMVGKLNAKAELDQRIRQVWKPGALKPVFFPREPSDVDDDSGPPKLAVIHYDAETVTVDDGANPPELVRTVAARKGTAGSYRDYRNNVVFLVADGDLVDRMVDNAQRYLAIQRITSDAARMQEFTDEQRSKLKKQGEAAELDVRVSITRAYRHFYFPDAAALQSTGNLSHDVLPAQEQGQVEPDQSAVVLRTLKVHNKVQTGDDAALAAQFVKSRAWDTNAAEMSTEALRSAFARRMSLPMLLDLNQLKKTIKSGVDAGVWVYYDSDEGLGYDAASPSPAVRVTDDAVLYLPEEAGRRGVAIKGRTVLLPVTPAICPVCLNPVDACTCEAPPLAIGLKGSGTPNQALQGMLDAAQDGRVTVVRSLRMTVEGSGPDAARDLRLVGLALPQLGKGDFQVEANLTAEFDGGQYLTVNLLLDDAMYKRLKGVTDTLLQEAGKCHVRVTIVARYSAGLDLEGDQFRSLHEVLTSIGLGPITVEADPVRDEAAL